MDVKGDPATSRGPVGGPNSRLAGPSRGRRKGQTKLERRDRRSPCWVSPGQQKRPTDPPVPRAPVLRCQAGHRPQLSFPPSGPVLQGDGVTRDPRERAKPMRDANTRRSERKGASEAPKGPLSAVVQGAPSSKSKSRPLAFWGVPPPVPRPPRPENASFAVFIIPY